jgi:hypothetical protein
LEEVDIKVTHGVGAKRVHTRKMVELSGRSPGIRYIVHNNSYVNVVRALIERVFFVEKKHEDGTTTLATPPTTTRGYFYNQMREFAEKLKDHLPHVSRMSLDKFVETSPPHKKKQYMGARAYYLLRGLWDQLAEVTSFVKAEKTRATGKDGAPRIIQPRGIVFNLIFGCFIRPAEKAIYKAIDMVFGRPTVVCGQNAVQQAEMLRSAWDELDRPVAYSLDLSRMDQHVSAVALMWEHTFYRFIFMYDTCFSTLDWCLKKTINNVGRVYTRDKTGLPVSIKYKKTGSRMSGDMNTSLGNKLIMCGLLYSYYRSYLGFEPRVDFNVVDNGDDCVVMLSHGAHKRYERMTELNGPLVSADWKESLSDTEIEVIQTAKRESTRKPLKRSGTWPMPGNGPLSLQQLALNALISIPTHKNVSKWFHDMGFTLKVEGFTMKFNHIEFCQTQPCWIDGRWVMVRGLKALGKDSYCLKPMEVLKKWLSQVKGGGLATYGSVPIYSAFYESLPGEESRDRSELIGTGMYYLSKNMDSKRVVTTQNRVEFWETFGVLPREQEVIEEYYRSMSYDERVTLYGYASPLLPLPVI